MIYVTYRETDEYGHQDLQDIWVGPVGIDLQKIIKEWYGSGARGTLEAHLAKVGLVRAGDDLVTIVEIHGD